MSLRAMPQTRGVWTRLWERWTLQVQWTTRAGGIYWRLPYLCRRFIARIHPTLSGVSAAQAAEILDRKALFIHVPKTAGVSVQHSLFGHVLVRHESFRQFEIAFTRRRLQSLFRFTFVRNPWDRLVSAWTFLREGGYNDQDKAWYARHIARFPDFESFVLNWLSREHVSASYVHFVPQVDFIRNGRGNLEMDFVGRFENLAGDFEKVARHLGCTTPLQSHNRPQTRKASSYREFYTVRSAEVVARAYRDDIETFGYEF
jgi:hypothetical protein